MAEAVEKGRKAHIDEIRSKKFSIGQEHCNPLNQDLHHAVTSLSAELYTKDVHFLMELIQNAEDNEYPTGVEPTLEFVLTKSDITGVGAPTTLLIFNNEVGFSTQNMESICSVGLSTKKGKRKLGFIGEKGIGFKSVFLVSTWPHVFSNGYQVKFSEEPDQYCGIGYIVPTWVDAKPTISCIHEIYGRKKPLPTTTIILPLKPDKVDAVKAQLSELHPEILLFLSKIKRLHVRNSNHDPKEPDTVSTVSIFSETNHMELRDKKADSRIVQLSVKDNISDAGEMCKYYMWRQAFAVKSENRISARMDVEVWIISLAFPFGERLRRGASSVGVFAFLPTAMVTNFPFIIQADFILASSRETILLDNKWNLGILECVPEAFINAFCSCVKEATSLISALLAFTFLPVRESPIHKLNTVRESIKAKLQKTRIVPCSSFYGGKSVCRLPSEMIRISPEFRELLRKVKDEGVSLEGLSSLKEYAVLTDLDQPKYSEILDFVGVSSADSSGFWYARCITACKIASMDSNDVYVELLLFIADHCKTVEAFRHIPLLKYTDRAGNVKLCTLSAANSQLNKVQYAANPEHHDWLNKCNMEFGCPNNIFLFPDSTLRAIVVSNRRYFLQNWLLCEGVKQCSIHSYAVSLSQFVVANKDPKLAVILAQFLYHSYNKKFLIDYEVSSICQSMPIIDGSGNLRTTRKVTLVCASGSKWEKLLGSSNPFIQHCYIDLWNEYGESGEFAGHHTPQKELLIFLHKYCVAKDLEGLPPPNVVLDVASSKLTCEQALLLLDWIRSIRVRNSYIPAAFLNSVCNGRWLKTYSGFASPYQSILPDATEEIIFDMMKKYFMEDFRIVNQEFYMNKISLYADELKLLGVKVSSNDVLKLTVERCKCCASSAMSKGQACALLLFLGYLKAANILDEQLLTALKRGKWLKTSQGYSASMNSILLPAEIEFEEVASITKMSVVDTRFYGSKITTFSPELALLGVVSDTELVFKLIAENLCFPLNLTAMTGKCGLFILKCIRYSGLASSPLVEKIRDHPWLRTSCGAKSPMESSLPDPEWIWLLNVIEAPIIDDAFYGHEIRSFMEELKAIGVAVEFDCVVKMISSHFTSYEPSSLMTRSKMFLLLNGIRQANETLSSNLTKLLNFLSGEELLKTRHGCKKPSEAILFNSKWGTISVFVDLPIVDDSFYGIGIYGFRDELKLMGVITDFERGAALVARGLNQPIESSIVTAEGTISLLECIKLMTLNQEDQSLLADFVENLKSNKLLKTTGGYKKPEESALFDPAWDNTLYSTDAPIVDQTFYTTDMSLFKDELKAIGVKVDASDVCAFLFGLLYSRMDTHVITRIYCFLSKFNWRPHQDKCNYQVWIPYQDRANGGEWVNSKVCVLHDHNNIFSSRFYSLDKYYAEELLPFFLSAFEVSEFPSISDYLQLWQSWALKSNREVTLIECCSFWSHFLDKCHSSEEILRLALTHVPAISSSGDKIHLVQKEEAFIPDDLQMKQLFYSVHKIPLFVWLPKNCSTPFVSRRRLCDVYEIIGVRKISESVQCSVSRASLCNFTKVNPRNGLIGRGLIKVILGFLAGPKSSMSEEQRHKAARSLLQLSVYECKDPILVTYKVMQPANVTVLARNERLVFWHKNGQQLLFDKSSYESWRTNIQFVSCFAQEIAGGLLTRERGDNLCNLIQMAFMFEFNEDAINFLLTKEDLEISKKDEEFLAKEFPSDESVLFHGKRLVLVPATPEASSSKKRRKCT